MSRELSALLVVAIYCVLCVACYGLHRCRQRFAKEQADALLPAAENQDMLLVLHASQTGQAEEIAWQTANMLHVAGMPVRLAALGETTRADLRSASRALFVASTYGEGDAPDSAARFAHDVMAAGDTPDLAGLRTGVLALGDSNYVNYCGFGRELDAWLRRQGAQALFERIDADKTDAAALAHWRHQLSHLAGTRDLPEQEAPAFARWRLARREHLNPGSSGDPAFHIELEPPSGVVLQPDMWEAGDLVQVQPPGENGAPREYSIASLPADGRLHLLVRRSVRPDGSLGAASGWLTQHADIGTAIPLRLRAHHSFRPGANAARPLILIGNGTGMAGLRAHMKVRARAGIRSGAWLLFGERHAAHDAFYRNDVEDWLSDGFLSRADWAFSRDQAGKRYVQHVLAEATDILRAWVDKGAAIYVCGSLEGMAQAVGLVLSETFGATGLRRLIEQGRYRRDVY